MFGFGGTDRVQGHVAQPSHGDGDGDGESDIQTFKKAQSSKQGCKQNILSCLIFSLTKVCLLLS